MLTQIYLSSHYVAKSHSLITSCILRPHPSHNTINLSNMHNMQIKKTGNAREKHKLNQSETDLAKIVNISGLLKLAFWKWELTITTTQRFLQKNPSGLQMKELGLKLMQSKRAKDLLCSNTIALKLLRNWVPIGVEKCIFQNRRKKTQIIEATLLLTLLLLPGLLLDWKQQLPFEHNLRKLYLSTSISDCLSICYSISKQELNYTWQKGVCGYILQVFC